jgi:hypothetical protein
MRSLLFLIWAITPTQILDHCNILLPMVGFGRCLQELIGYLLRRAKDAGEVL